MKITAGLEYDDRGVGAVPLICLHGIGGNTDSFAPQLHAFASEWRIISVNLPGYGRSSSMDDFSFKGLAERMVAFLSELGVERAHFVGQSIGGMIAQEVACRFPTVVQSLTLIGTTSAFGGRDDSFKEQFIAARLKPLEDGVTIPELAEKFVPEIVGPVATPDAVHSAVSSMSQVPAETYHKIIKCLVTFNRRADISGLDIPCCLIAGKVDQNAPVKTMQRMAEKIPRAEYHVVSGAGHLINLEAPEQTNKIIAEFLENHERHS